MIIFCDPPYADPAIPATLAALGAWPGLDPQGVLVIGHATPVALPDSAGACRFGSATANGAAWPFRSINTPMRKLRRWLRRIAEAED